MKRLLSTTPAVLLLFALTGAGVAHGQGNLTLSASQATIKFGASVTLSGKLTGPNNDARNVQLREDPFPFAEFDNVANTTTDSQGNYSFVTTPAVNTRYQTRQSGTESTIVTVEVSPAISLRLSDRTPSAGARVRFSGQVCPEHDGASLRIQRRVARNRWRTVRSTSLEDVPGASCSGYTRRVRVARDGTYRTFLAAHDDHARGSSRGRRINVH